MRFPVIGVVVLVSCTAAFGQGSTPKQTTDQPKIQADVAQDLGTEIGFRYEAPQGWTVLATKPLTAPASAQPIEGLTKKGSACIEVSLTAEHGDPASVILIVGLPFGCYGQAMTASDLPGLGSGVADGLKQELDITGPITASYVLGSHTFWTERAKGTPKGQTMVSYTVETACTLLRKGAACWMVMAADEVSLKDFEQARVALEGDAPTALVPDLTFAAPAP